MSDVQDGSAPSTDDWEKEKELHIGTESGGAGGAVAGSGESGDDDSYLSNSELYDNSLISEPVEAAQFVQTAGDGIGGSEENKLAGSGGEIMTDAGPVALAPVDDIVDEVKEEVSSAVKLSPEVVEIINRHRQWLESQHENGRRADFRSFDLQGANFSGLRLSEANFRGVNLSGAIFDGADLRGVDLSDAILTRASFSGSNLEGANLARCEAEFGNFEHANMSEVNLSGAQLRGARFRDVQLPGAIMRDSLLQNAVLIHANLRESVLKGADLCEVVLEDADMTMADCRGANFERAAFTRAVVDQVEFRGANMTGTDLNATNFSRAHNVDTKFQAEAYETGRQELQEELSELEHMRQEIARREKVMYNDKMALEREKEHILNLQLQEKEFITRLRKYIKWFKISSVVWLLLALAFLSFAVNAIANIDIEKLNLLEIGIIVAVIVAVMLLFAGSFISSVLINRNLNKMQEIREEGMSVAAGGIVTGVAVETANIADAQDILPEGEGFGKKRQ